jgi:predicted lactoylglutathione lyase
MNSHVSSILLGVSDMDRSKRFYTEGLGWKVQQDYGSSMFFVPHGGPIAGFYGGDGLAANVGVSADGSGFSGVVFTYVVRSEARVDQLMTEGAEAGATILKPAAKLEWGGYGGSFSDSDGYIWNIGYSAEPEDQPYAEWCRDRPRAGRMARPGRLSDDSPGGEGGTGIRAGWAGLAASWQMAGSRS